MFPSERAKAAGAPVEVDISRLEPGQKIDVEWRGKVVWIMNRTPEMLASLKALTDKLADPQSKNAAQQPKYGLAFRWLAAVQASKKEYEKAKASFERALALNPQDAASMQGLATVYIATNKTAEGLKRIEKIVAQQPDFAPAVAILASLQTNHVNQLQRRKA
jgi:tetratricopeptide (TPR) repeat protein